MPSLGELVGTILLTLLVCSPLALSAWALLDAARRPAWAWALAERDRVSWMVAIMLGTFVLCAGVAVSLWYLAKVRPLVAAAESGPTA